MEGPYLPGHLLSTKEEGTEWEDLGAGHHSVRLPDGVRWDEVNGVNQRPPIGLKPRWLFVEERLREILTAIGRYQQAGRAVPTEWEMEATLRFEELRGLSNNG